MRHAVSVATFVVSCAALCLGAVSLSVAKDVSAFYWLAMGAVALRASVAFVRPGGQT